MKGSKMATENVTNISTALGPLLEGDFDVLCRKLSVLSANMHMATGDGFETFSNYNDKIQHNYLWGCSLLADECLEIMNKNTGA